MSSTVSAMMYPELEVEVEGSAVPPSGDGWNEPRDPGGMEDVRLVLGEAQIADVRKILVDAGLTSERPLSDTSIEGLVETILTKLYIKRFANAAAEALESRLEELACDEE